MEVKHFIACAETLRILPKEPQRTLLHDVRFTHLAEPGHDFPIIIDKVCLFTRFYGAVGTHRFSVKVIWQGKNNERRLIRAVNSRPLEFNPIRFVNDYSFAVSELRVPGEGMLEFQLTRLDMPEIILATDFVEVWES